MAHVHAQSLLGGQSNRTSETEEQRKERLRISCEKDRVRSRTSHGSHLLADMLQLMHYTTFKKCELRMWLCKPDFLTYHIN